MSFSSYFIGLSGILAGGERLSMIGNNIANMNTVGFKENRIEFANLVRNSLVGERGPIAGNGVAVTGSSLNFAQGALAQSNNPMDWAIDGNGFFVAKDSAGNSFYTRNGQFRLRATEDTYSVTNAAGLTVQGFLAQDTTGASSSTTSSESTTETASTASTSGPTFASTLSNLTFNAVMNAKATSTASAMLNLDAHASVVDAEFNPDDPSTYSFAASQVVYDAAGGQDASHTMTTYFVKTDENTWDVHVRVDDGEAADIGQMEFGTDGKLQAGATGSVTVDVPIGEGETASTLSQTIAFDFTGTTQYGTDSTVLSQSQDGYNRGELQSITLGSRGIIYGNYSNQRHEAMAQVGLAAFGAPWGLRQSSQGLYVPTDDSGAATVVNPETAWVAGNPSVGEVRSGFNELSNVAITDNFVEMIATQFGFQANSKAIMASDEALQQAINLKR